MFYKDVAQYSATSAVLWRQQAVGNLHPWPELQIIRSRSLCFASFTLFNITFLTILIITHFFLSNKYTVYIFHPFHSIPSIFLASFHNIEKIIISCEVLHTFNKKLETKNNLGSPNMSQGICTDLKFGRNLHSFVILYLGTRVSSSPLFVKPLTVTNINVDLTFNKNIIVRERQKWPCDDADDSDERLWEISNHK